MGPRSHWSEAATVFDPERLKEIISELAAELKPFARDARIKDLDHKRQDEAAAANS